MLHEVDLSCASVSHTHVEVCAMRRYFVLRDGLYCNKHRVILNNLLVFKTCNYLLIANHCYKKGFVNKKSGCFCCLYG